MFLTMTNTPLAHLVPDNILHEGQVWAEPFWNTPGGEPVSPNQRFRVGTKTVLIVTIFLNKAGEDLAYWMVEEGKNVPFFKTWEEIKKAMDDKKLIKI